MFNIASWFSDTPNSEAEELIDETLDEATVDEETDTDEETQPLDDATEEDEQQSDEETEETDETDGEQSETEEEATESEITQPEEPVYFTETNPLVRRILDAEGNFIDVQLTEEDILELAADKSDGFKQTLMETVEMTAPLVKTYSQVPMAKWLIDSINAGHKVEDLVKMIAEDSIRRGVVDVEKILSQTQEDEYLTAEEKRIRDLEKEIESTKKMLQDRETKEQNFTRQQQQKTQMLANVEKNQQHLTTAFDELGIDQESLNEEDINLIQQAFLTLYPKDPKNPKAGIIGIEEREYKYNQIKGIVNLALKINKPQVEQTKKKVAVQKQVKQAKAPKIAPGNVSASASKTLDKPSPRKDTYYSEAERVQNVRKLFQL
jgi:hypothetical protein